MKVSCLSSTLAEGLGIVSRATSPRNYTFGNVLIQTDRNMLRLSATDLEIGINLWVPSKGPDEFTALVPAKLLTEFVKSLPEERIDAEMAQGSYTLGISCGRFSANISTLDPEMFPRVTVDTERHIEIDAQVLKRAIGRVVFAAAKEQARPILTGVLLSFDTNGIRFAAADGFRVAVTSVDTPHAAHEPFDVIVPARALAEVAKLIRDDETVVIARSTDRNQVLFAIGENVEVITQIIQGKFPDYKQIMPTEHSTRVVIDTRALLDAVKTSFVFARDAAFVLKLHFETDAYDSGTARLFASSNGNQCVGELDCDVEGEEPLDIAFSAEYLRDVISVIGTDKTTLELINKNSPGVFREHESDAFMCVVMPMHID